MKELGIIKKTIDNPLLENFKKAAVLAFIFDAKNVFE